jgi:hypothetical protein
MTKPTALKRLSDVSAFLGDSDCYHNDRHGNSTQTAIAVADLYVQPSTRCRMGGCW